MQPEPRFKKRVPCDLIVAGARHPGIVLNISRGGLYVQTSVVFQRGAWVAVDLNSRVEQAIGLDAVVMWNRKVAAQLRGVRHGGVGLQIRNAGREGRATIYDSFYSRTYTQRILDLLRSEMRVRLILFNDSRVRGVQHWPNHANHFHVRIYCSRRDRIYGCVDSEPLWQHEKKTAKYLGAEAYDGRLEPALPIDPVLMFLPRG